MMTGAPVLLRARTISEIIKGRYKKMKQNTFEIDMKQTASTHYFTKKEFNLFIIEINCAIDAVQRRTEKDFKIFLLPNGSFYKVTPIPEVLRWFLKQIKANRVLLMGTGRFGSNKTDREYRGCCYATCTVKRIKGQMRMIPPNQENLLTKYGRKKWPKTTYTGKIRKVRSRGGSNFTVEAEVTRILTESFLEIK